MKISFRQGLRHLRGSMLKGHKPAVLMLVFAVSASVVASPPAPAPASSVSHPHHWYQVGKASWYGRGFQGKRTATGERFDMNALTCAHRTLPLGSWLRVTNLKNRRSTFVRVNDRGPYEGDAVIDLSFAAAQRVGLLGKAPVRVERVSPDDPELVAEVTAHDAPTAIAR